MQVQGFDHMFLETKNYDAMVAFWQAIGFEVKDQWGSKADGHLGCMMRCGSSVVVIGTVGPKESPQAPTMHFSVKSVDQLAAALKGKKGIEIVTQPEPTHWNTRWLRVKDPEGNIYAIESQG